MTRMPKPSMRAAHDGFVVVALSPISCGQEIAS